MSLTFDEEAHRYQWHGHTVPSVTQVLTPLIDYSGIPRKILDQAAARGNYVHKMCELFLWGTLDESTVDEIYLPYLEGFKKFLKETEFEPEYLEQRVYHPKLGYAGTFDMGGILPPWGRKKTRKRVLIDLKTTFKLMRSVGPQTKAYCEAAQAMDPAMKFEERYGLQLKKDGTYKLRAETDTRDWNVFLSCLNIHNYWQEEKRT